MDIIYVLIPLSLILLSIAVLVFFWAVRSGQFDDMDSPAHRILFDDDEPIAPDADNTQADQHNSANNSH